MAVFKVEVVVGTKDVGGDDAGEGVAILFTVRPERGRERGAI